MIRYWATLLRGLKERRQDLLHGFVLIPGMVALLCLALAAVLTRVDRSAGPTGVPFGFGGSASTALSILATIASSLITVAVLALSLTVITLQLISGQFTPRAMRGFLGDRVTQIVTGGFVGIFAYCLLVLTTVRLPGESHGEFIPSLSVAVGIGFGFAGLMLLLIFIHHMAQVIQVSHIVARIARETLQAIEHLYPDEIGAPYAGESVALLAAWSTDAAPGLVYPDHPGFVQAVVIDEVTRDLARAGALRLHLQVCPGDFVTQETPIAAVWPAKALEHGATQAVRAGIVVRYDRDMSQDAGFGIRQITDIALRALSPAVNDPTTAVTCIGYLQAIGERLVRRALPATVRCFPEVKLLAVLQQRGVCEYLEAFVEIGRYATADARVAGAVLDALLQVASACSTTSAPVCFPCLRDIAVAVAEPALAHAATDHDRRMLSVRLHSLEQRLAAQVHP